MSDGADIARLIGVYLDGLYEGDVQKLQQVFHPTCCLTYAVDGQPVIVSRDDWFAAVANRPKPVDLGLSRHDEIVTIDVLDPQTAFVKVKCAIPPRFFIDLLSLLKVGGHWQVMQKVSAVAVRDEQ